MLVPTIFELYHDCQFYWKRNREDPRENLWYFVNHRQIYHIRLCWSHHTINRKPNT